MVLMTGGKDPACSLRTSPPLPQRRVKFPAQPLLKCLLPCSGRFWPDFLLGKYYTNIYLRGPQCCKNLGYGILNMKPEVRITVSVSSNIPVEAQNASRKLSRKPVWQFGSWNDFLSLGEHSRRLREGPQRLYRDCVRIRRDSTVKSFEKLYKSQILALAQNIRNSLECYTQFMVLN